MHPSLIRSCAFVCLALPFSSLPSFGEAGKGQAQQAGTDLPQQSDKQSKAAIEQFMMLTALYLIELEWNAGYSNRTPDKDERARAMISADLSACPADFREAWLKQVENPRRNYAAPIFRKYGVTLAPLRKRLEKELASIDLGIHPPIPLFDEEESAPSFDPRTCGSRENILKATSLLKMKLYGIDSKMAPVWQQAVKRVMIDFSINYMEAMVRLQFGQLSADDVTRLFKGIKLNDCPAEFRKAWEHDLPYFIKGQFGSPELRTAPTALRYGVDAVQVMDLVRKKMREWEIETPSEHSLPTFIKEMQDLRDNMTVHR